jgi:hypothetical protein
MSKSFDYFIDKILDKLLMFIFVSICTFIGNSFTKLTDSVVELNSTMKLVVEDARATKEKVNAHEPRIDRLEDEVLILKTKRNKAQED